MSTGICARLVRPRTTTTRQKTIIRYGCRIENEAIGLLFHFSRFHDLRRHPLPRLILALGSKNHAVIFVQARDNLDLRSRLQAKRDGASLDLIGAVYDQDGPLIASVRLNSLS